MNITSENLRNSCFFCSRQIDGRKSKEHIISDSLLGKLGIKEQTVGGVSSFQYSRVKVPAHGACNSGFGSAYENKIIKLLNDTDKLFEKLKSEENEFPFEIELV